MRSIRALVLVLTVTVGVAACSSDKGSDGAKGTTTTAPEEKRTSDANVAKGLAAIATKGGQVAELATSDKGAAEKLLAENDATWFEIEGTIKANDTEAYLEFEDSLALMRTGTATGKPDTVTKALARFTTASGAYLKAHPA